MECDFNYMKSSQNPKSLVLLSATIISAKLCSEIVRYAHVLLSGWTHSSRSERGRGFVMYSRAMTNDLAARSQSVNSTQSRVHT